MYMGKYRIKRERRNCDGRIEVEAVELQGCFLGAEQAAIVKNRNSIKTHFMLQKDLSDQYAFFLL